MMCSLSGVSWTYLATSFTNLCITAPKGSYCQRKYLHTQVKKIQYSLKTFYPKRLRMNHRLISSSMQDNFIAKDKHIPVLVDEVMNYLKPGNGKLYVDMTFGAGGHTKAILEHDSDARVVCLDRDPTAYNLCLQLKSKYKEGQILPCFGKFSNLPHLLKGMGISPGSVDGVLFDVGMSSMQLDESTRGFALSMNGPLDMRMDQTSDEVNAADVVNGLDEEDLANIIKYYGEDKMYKKIAHAIVEARAVFGKITSTTQLAAIVSSIFPEGHTGKDKLSRNAHVATRTFQALRIFVNNELNELNNGLEVAFHYLKRNGCCVAISFHSLEDRIIKRHFHDIDMDDKYNMNVRDHARRNDNDIHIIGQILERKRWTPVSKNVLKASEEECLRNPRSRSAKLRVALKTQNA